jgi:hypothetical protein
MFCKEYCITEMVGRSMGRFGISPKFSIQIAPNPAQQNMSSCRLHSLGVTAGLMLIL